MLLPQRQQTLTVRVIAHDGLSVVAALNNMVRVSGNSEAGLAGHEDSLGEARSLIGI
jgi:hypothetical protein